MAKITLIGAGSLIFAKTLVQDILATPVLQDSELVLMSRTEQKLRWSHEYVQRVIRDNKLPARATFTTDRGQALEGADYVICMIQVGGVDAVKKDYEIPLKYGVDQCIGDTLGPGGVMRGIRTIPIMLDIAHDMERICPKAVLLNYSNPMAALCYALGRGSRIPFVGLCHGIQTTLHLLAGYLGVDKQTIDYQCAGINHMAWFLKLRQGGEDLYPRLHEIVERPEVYVTEKVRCEVMRHFGYFMTESTGHLSEYLPYFRKNKKALQRYCDRPAFGGESGAAAKNYQRMSATYRSENFLSRFPSDLEPRSVEYCSYIMEAMETGHPFRFHGNVRNDAYISNLPQGSCVEIPITADKEGLHPHKVGALPAQLAALCQTNVTVQGLLAEACISGDLELAFAAMALDPLTSAVLTLSEIRRMTMEMIEAEREHLPPIFRDKVIQAKPSIRIPDDVKPVDTPLDPALAVVRHMRALAQGDKKP